MGASERIVAEVRRWLQEFVIGLDLCPFAAEPVRSGRVRFRVAEAETVSELLEDLMAELAHLDRESPEQVETTILIHPRVLDDFAAFNQFADVSDLALEKSGLRGAIQVVGFHPDHRFAGLAADDVANAANRAPFPMLHLLREASVERALRTHADPAGIPERNSELLKRLGWAEVEVRLRGRRPA